jgi:hypothetical protein
VNAPAQLDLSLPGPLSRVSLLVDAPSASMTETISATLAR